jgi:hypothetical protein
MTKDNEAELRRLHAENKELREANEAFGKRQEWWNSRMANMEAENEAKDVLLRQAWAVIRWQCFGECRTDGVEGLPTPSEIDAAIRQHLKETK